VDEDCNLDIFEQNTNISEPMKNLWIWNFSFLNNTKWMWKK
jgi:hypothetical protein